MSSVTFFGKITISHRVTHSTSIAVRPYPGQQMENETRIRFMFQKRSLTTGFLVASLGIAAGLAVVSSPSVASAEGDCHVKHDKLKKACKDGGKKGVVDAMKAAVKAAKGKEKGPDGKDLDCATCHENQKDYKLKEKGQELFDSHLAKYL
jgi:hypothetical protein